jgi:transposase InsO family protein
MIPLILKRLEKARQEFTWTQLCYGLIPCATVLRWRAREKAGEPVLEKAGPKKKEPLPGPLLKQQIQQLQHRRRRTAGSNALYEQWSEFISRRHFQELVAQERQNRIDDMKRIQWLRPGAAWSLDTTEYGSDKTKITPLRDLASKYQVPTPLVQPTEDGTQIARYLDSMFTKEGPPMFLKRDLGSPLNCQAVDQVLERHRVLPLNSPPGYPRYNGSMERGMRDLKSVLDEQRLQATVHNLPMTLEVELATHKLNHRQLRSLGGLTPCQFYHDPHRRLRLHGAIRDKISREIFAQFWQLAQCMPDRNRHSLNAAWRLIVEDWLRRQRWISVRENQNQNVSTNSNGFFSQN